MISTSWIRLGALIEENMVGKLAKLIATRFNFIFLYSRASVTLLLAALTLSPVRNTPVHFIID